MKDPRDPRSSTDVFVSVPDALRDQMQKRKLEDVFWFWDSALETFGGPAARGASRS